MIEGLAQIEVNRPLGSGLIVIQMRALLGLLFLPSPRVVRGNL